ncbi:VOC family protein [Actinokineospora sp. PR83]|uniref:VOC family protein n=1 Tax=Actinokineospora sp. PR83 TaxID=2884908 RepID=UPI0027DF2663|nr:VOC family protein [Actinokineospora sp. PR83]MCG8918391.1 VOC family protein [Actinokineospora sp. PR83]
MALGFQVTFDALDPGRQAGFWALALGYELEPPPPGFATWEEFGERIGMPPERWGDLAAVVAPDRDGPRVLFQRVPEDKAAKNRVHLDVHVDGPRDEGRWERVTAHARRLVEAGATLVAERHENIGNWIVLLDPEGNEFCVQ